MANIVVSCDGTWNTPNDMDGGLLAPTNVVKLSNALAAADGGGVEQKKYYHPGVGTDGTWWDRLAGGGTGEGLDRNIKSAYQWLAANYRQGDKIYLFGFSRGAYTARSLGGMLCKYGLLDLSDPTIVPAEAWRRVDVVFDCYRAKNASAELLNLKSYNKRPGDQPEGTTKIHFVGVWDTVGALGVPDDMALLNLIDDPAKHSFHDTDLSAHVLNARHAVAIDEKRQSFVPTLWTKVADRKDVVKQIWFPGVHSDVGGGYGLTGLSDGALGWMMDEATLLGLKLRDGVDAQLRPDPRGFLHDSCTGIFKLLKASPRNVPNLASNDASMPLHKSALERFKNPSIQQADYWPTATLSIGPPKKIDVFASQQWNSTGLFLEDGAEYEFSAEGEWLDGTVKCDPEGTTSDDFAPGELVHMALSAFGQAETLFRKLTHNQQADFWGTKRVEDFKWFALIGVVANGIGADGKGDPIPHLAFKIGKGCKLALKPGQSGYLYCFANDAWQAYANNKGSVSMTVKRTK